MRTTFRGRLLCNLKLAVVALGIAAFGYVKRHGFRRAWYILRTGEDQPDWETLGPPKSHLAAVRAAHLDRLAKYLELAKLALEAEKEE